FDDGYEDNFIAAEILRRLGLPCTFFVSTQLMNCAKGFDHDWQRLGQAVPTLSWEQIRQMRRWGFELSNHTATHANLATLPLSDSVREVSLARQDLEREIGQARCLDWLAYPYGRRSDMTEELRRALPSVGIRSCLSGCGGTNSRDFDPLDILRQPVDQ